MYTGNNYNASYAPYFTQYNANKMEITRVNGRNGAEAFNMPPNSSVLLLDETSPIVWLKQTDGAGYPTLVAYEITPAQTAEQKEATKFAAIEQRLSSLEEIINGKSYISNDKQRKDKPTSNAD